MAEQEDPVLRIRERVADLCQREVWGLSSAEVAAYAHAVVGLAPEHSGVRLDQCIQQYHQHHTLVAALRQDDHPSHHSAWAWVEQEIRRAAALWRLDWSSDRSIERDDLVQIARSEIARALPAYRYESSVRTWLQQVTRRRLNRLHRDNSADKRSGRPISIEEITYEPVDWTEYEHDVYSTELLALIRRSLGDLRDPRLADMFLLNVVDDWSTSELGARFDLHPSRIRALLRATRDHLSQDQNVQRWRRSSESSDLAETPHPEND